jgi:hypothetical protein
MGYTTLIECEIDPLDKTLVQIRPYKLAFEEQREAAKIIEQPLKEKAIARSNSDWAAPAFLVPKPNGGWRLVTDLRLLNQRCRDWKMPLPAIEDVFQKLGESELFCVMDITKGFWNVPISPESRKYTAFTLRNIGLFEYLVMPMGLKNSPATFARLCELVFPSQDFKDFLQCFLDDLCIFCRDFKSLVRALDKVLERIIFANLKLHPRKSHLAVEEVDYLGHTIFKGGVRVSKKKSAAVRKLTPPTSFKELQSLIGLFSYFRTFIANFSKIARPLTDMLKPENPFMWTPECQRAFEELKEKLCSEPILTRYRPELMCILDCDYQGQTLGAVLSQKHLGEKVERVLAYSSRTLKRAELKYSPTEGELLALLHGLKAFRQYLAGGSRFLVRTDHWALKWLRKHNPSSGRLARWLYEIDSHFIFDVEHRPGGFHKVLDGLSRLPATHLKPPIPGARGRARGQTEGEYPTDLQ